MTTADKFIIGTSGFSFPDWSGAFYPAGMKAKDMLAEYIRHFRAVELNFTYYAIPTPRTLERMALVTPPGFAFWVKANQLTTHERDRSVAGPFRAALAPLAAAGKLAGVLLQFPQSFHRTPDNRQYLAAALEDFAGLPLAVEFRHRSWDAPATVEGLRGRGVALVVPDTPPLPDLFRPPPTLTAPAGYLRLHSRNADGWRQGGMAQRYDYSYSEQELHALVSEWSPLAEQADRVYVFFNNCHRGQAAQNAEALRRILGQI